MKKKHYSFTLLPLIILSACNSGTNGSINPSLSQNIQLSTKSSPQNTAAVLSQINKLKNGSSIKIAYAMDGQPLNTGTYNWGDIGWHLLTLTVTKVPTGAPSVSVGGVIGTVGDGTNLPQYGEKVEIKDINCSSATFGAVGNTCSVYVRASYDYTVNPNVNPLIVVNLYPGNWQSLPDSIQPKDNVTSQATVGIYRPIHTFETQYYSGSSVNANPSQYRMLLMENGSINPITVNNISAISNPSFTQLHRTTSGNNDPIYGPWSECALTANTSLNQVSTLPNLNSQCIIIYQAASTSTTTIQTANVTIGTNSDSSFPNKAGSYTLQGNYNSTTPNGINWNPTTMPVSVSSGWSSVVYGMGKFVAFGQGAASATSTTFPVAYSTDGINWNPGNLSSLSAPDFGSPVVGYGDNIFVALTGGGSSSVTSFYSTDGINWNSSPMPSNLFEGWVSITYGNGKFVAVSGDGGSAYSIDGIHWIKGNLQQGLWNTVTYGNGVFVVASGDTGSSSAYSTDGINWTPILSQLGAALTYGDGMFVSPGVYSQNGINWNLTSTLYYWFYYVTYGNGIFVATSFSTTSYSPDGVNWNSTNSLPSQGDTIAAAPIAYGNGKFVAVYDTSSNTNSAAYGTVTYIDDLTQFVINSN